jgi:hypothetical protein
LINKYEINLQFNIIARIITNILRKNCFWRFKERNGGKECDKSGRKVTGILSSSKDTGKYIEEIRGR